LHDGITSRVGSDHYSIGLCLSIVKKHVADDGTAIERVVERMIVIESFQPSVEVGYLISRMLHIFRISANA